MKNQKPPVIPFTQKGFDKLKSDLKQLNQKRQEVVVRLQTAREMGDLSENAAYKAARFELGGIDRQLHHLNYLLKYGQVKKPQNNHQINFGNLVSLETNNTKLNFTLVSKYESDPKQQKISLDSPLGQALLGKKVGDKVSLENEAGSTSYTVLKIE